MSTSGRCYLPVFCNHIEDDTSRQIFLPIVVYGRCYSHMADVMATRVDLFHLEF